MLGLLVVIMTLFMIITAAFLAVPNKYSLESLDFLVPVFTAACIGGLIIYQKPGNRIGWFIAAFAFFLAFGEFSRQYALFGVLTQPGSLPFARAMAVNATWSWFPGIMCITVLIPLYFPNGRLLSRRWQALVWIEGLVVIAEIFFAITQVGDWETPGIQNPLGSAAIIEAISAFHLIEIIFGIWTGITILSAISLVIRYRRAETAEQKQIKWFAFALICLAIYTLLDIVIKVEMPDFSFSIILQAVWIILGISILWYHLFDIDLIIRRTLVYSILTGLLGVLYFGGVTLFQAILTAGNRLQTAASEKPSPFIIVITTLAIAALFNPLRRRIQDFIDRRFYRQKYDAEKALAVFASATRNEADLESLASILIETTTNTLHPKQHSVWIFKK